MSIDREPRARYPNVARAVKAERDPAEEDTRTQQKIYEDALLDALALAKAGAGKKCKGTVQPVPTGTAGRKPER